MGARSMPTSVRDSATLSLVLSLVIIAYIMLIRQSLHTWQLETRDNFKLSHETSPEFLATRNTPIIIKAGVATAHPLRL